MVAGADVSNRSDGHYAAVVAAKTKINGKHEILGLTALRGFLACWVLLLHLREVRHGVFIDLGVFNRLAQNGGLGVDLFFCLSGYVIAHVYYTKFERGLHHRDYARFLCYRVGRLYPIHILTMIVMLFVYLAATRLGVSSSKEANFLPTTILANLFLVQAWITTLGSPNGPAWSVSAEFLAYLMFPLMVLGASRMTRHARLVGLVIIVCAMFYLLLWNNPEVVWPSPGLQVLVEFGLGMTLWINRRDFDWEPRVPRSCGLIGLAGMAAAICFADHPEPWVVLAFLFLLVGFSNKNDLLGSLATRRGLLYLGEISYSIYMVHWLVWTPWKYGFGVVFRDVDIMTPWFMLPPAIASLYVASLAYHNVELPARAWLRRWADARFSGQGLVAPAVLSAAELPVQTVK